MLTLRGMKNTATKELVNSSEYTKGKGRFLFKSGSFFVIFCLFEYLSGGPWTSLTYSFEFKIYKKNCQLIIEPLSNIFKRLNEARFV